MNAPHMNITFTTLDLLTNSLIYADLTHPVDLIEPLHEQPDFPEAFEPAGYLIRDSFLFFEGYEPLHDKGLAVIALLVALRPELIGSVKVYHPDFAVTSTCPKTGKDTREEPLLGEFLAWCAQGTSISDAGLRATGISRALLIGKAAGMTFAEIGALKPCSKQRVESLDAEFRATFNIHD